MRVKVSIVLASGQSDSFYAHAHPRGNYMTNEECVFDEGISGLDTWAGWFVLTDENGKLHAHPVAQIQSVEIFNPEAKNAS